MFSQELCDLEIWNNQTKSIIDQRPEVIDREANFK